MDQSPTLGTRPNRQALRVRPRGLRGNISALIFQPRTFFRELATLESNRHGFWVGVLVLALSGFAAVQLKGLQTVTTDPFAVGVVPPDASETWTTALLAASVIVITWLMQAVLLCEVSLLNGKAPRFGLNLRIAIWASLPLGLMAILKLLYFSAGGLPPPAGISSLLLNPPFDTVFKGLPSFGQSLLMTLTAQVNFFWLWSLVLLYLGARHALNGRRIAAVLVIVAWVVLLVMIPAIANNNAASVAPIVQPTF